MRAFLLSLPSRYQALIIIGTTIILAFIIAFLCSGFFDITQLKENTDLISSVYQVMGTIYAILLTFTLWGTWQSFTDADNAVQKEAFALLDLVHILETASVGQNIPIRMLAQKYVRFVIEKEWPALKNLTTKNINLNEQTRSASEDIIKEIQNINPQNAGETAVLGQAFSLLNNWLDGRRSRLLIARGDSAKSLWPLLITGAFVLFAFHGLFVANTIGIWVTLLFGISLVIGLTFYLIFTLDCPFSGSPSIDSEPFALASDILIKKSIE